jgi:hypothetical protein
MDTIDSLLGLLNPIEQPKAAAPVVQKTKKEEKKLNKKDIWDDDVVEEEIQDTRPMPEYYLFIVELA